MAVRGLGLRGLETREALLLAFFATFVVIARAAMRWHLHIPGHSLLPAALLLVLARACVDRPAAASIVGVLAGLVCTALGMGSDGPLIALRLALPGVAVDVGWKLLPGRMPPLWFGALLGAGAGATHFLPVWIAESLAGVPAPVVASHALLAAGTKAGFGAAGGAAAMAIAGRLEHHGVIAPSRSASGA